MSHHDDYNMSNANGPTVENNHGLNKVVSKSSIIFEKFNRIDGLLQDLNGNLSDLESKLLPVLGPDGGAAGESIVDPLDASELARGLESYGDRIIELIYRVQNLQVRVEL